LDSNAKFGTLVLNRGLTEVFPGTTVGMQIGRTMMVFQVKAEDKPIVQIGLQMKKANEKAMKEYQEKRAKAKKDLESKPRRRV